MLILTGLLTAAGLTAAQRHPRDPRHHGPAAPAWRPHITIIIDDDGYIELRFWAGPGTTPSQFTTTLTRAISVIAG